MIIKFSPPDITDLEIANVIEALKSGWITTGPKTKLFEKQIAEYCGTSKAVCLNSATACLELALRVLGIKAGDEVITSAYTYTASASVIEHVGAKIIMVDVAKDGFTLDYEQVREAITPKTKAIIPVDLAGVMCDYDLLNEIVESKKDIFVANNEYQKAINKVAIIADAAHSFGAKYKGKVCGTGADFTSFSFHAVKNLTTADGGAIVWKDIRGISNDEIYKQFMLLSLHGQSKDALAKTAIGSWEYDIITTGYKCNMTDVVASIGIGQLARYEGLLKRRKEIVAMFDKKLSVNKRLIIPKNYFTDYESSGHLYLLRIKDATEQERNKIIIAIAEKGIATNVHYKPLPMHTAYKELGFDIKNYPNAYNQYKNEITLPLHTLLTNEEIDYICSTVLEIVDAQ